MMKVKEEINSQKRREMRVLALLVEWLAFQEFSNIINGMAP
jgi:hypothetical protein